MSQENKQFYTFPAIISIIFLLLTFFNWSYGFYGLLRWVVTGVAVYYAYYLHESLKRSDFWFWTLAGIAVLFNPVIPIYLYDKTAWGLIDIVTAVFFLMLITKFKNK